MKNASSAEINAPPGRVFELLNDSESLKQWIPNLVENEQLTSAEGGVGSKFRQVYLENGRRMEMEGEVTAYEQDKFLACEIRGKAFTLLVDYSLEPLGAGTTLTQNSEVIFNSVPMKIIGTLLRPMLRKTANKSQDDQFERLKALAEA